MEATSKKRALAYVRFSHEIQRGNSSEDRQKSFTEEVCNELNLELVDTLMDDGVSARNGDNLKSNFAQFYDLIQSGDYIIIESWTRLSRAGFGIGYEAIKPLVIDKQAHIIIGRDDDGKLVEVNKTNIDTRRILNFMVNGFVEARKENEDRIDKLKKQYRIKGDKIKEGKYVPYGQRPCWLSCPRDPNNGRCIKDSKFVVDEDKVKTIQLIFDLYANHRQSIQKICTFCNTKKLPLISRPRKNTQRQWFTMSIYHLLTNKAVIGYFVKRDKSHWHGMPEWESKIFPPIIDEKLFYATQKILSQNYKTHTKDRKRSSDVNLLGGMVGCKCGGRLTLRYNRKYGPRPVKYLGCNNGFNGTCMYRYKTLDMKRVEFVFKTILSRTEILDNVLSENKPVAPSMVPQLQSELEKLRKERRNLYNVIKGLNEGEHPADLIKEIQASLEKERGLIKRIEDENIRLSGNQPLKTAIRTYRERLDDKWDKEEYRPQIRGILREVVEKSVADIGKKTMQVWLKNTPDPLDVKLNDKGIEIEGLKFSYENTKKQPDLLQLERY